MTVTRFSGMPSVAKVALTATSGAAGVLSWRNPHVGAIFVERLLVDITTAATSAATVDFGTAATAISNDGLLDGLDVNAATGLFDNVSDGGTNGKARQRVAAGEYVTGSRASGDVTGLVGNAYIQYIEA